jgi:hypothetical protein
MSTIIDFKIELYLEGPYSRGFLHVPRVCLLFYKFPYYLCSYGKLQLHMHKTVKTV